jgi:hypothetical protein
MEQWTPWLLLLVSGVGVILWFVIRKAIARMDSMAKQLGGLEGVPQTIKNLESLVKDELRHFDVRITRLEARSEMRQDKP